MNIAVERPPAPVRGGQADTNRIPTILLCGWLTAAGKAAAATITYTQSSVLPRVSSLTQRATRATGETLVEV